MYKLSNRSLNNLKSVDLNLINIVKHAIKITTQDFMVIEGLRTREQCYINYGKGRTQAECIKKQVPARYANPNTAKVTWLTNPLGSKHVTGRAVDLVPFPLDWNDINKFNKIAEAMKKAAQELKIDLRWGGDWKHSKDYPHFEV